MTKYELDYLGQRIESLGALLRKEETNTGDLPRVCNSLLESLILLIDLTNASNTPQVDESEEEDCCL